MANTLAIQADAPGKGRTTQVYAHAAGPLKVAVYDWDQGTQNYTVGGEDISTIFTDFPRGVLYIGIEQKDTNTAADNRILRIDYTNKVFLIYTALTTEATAVDQGVVAARFFVVGLR